MEIDELDRQVVHCLSIDGRASFSRIAEIMGVSDQTVARRYRRLRSHGVLRVVGLPAAKQPGRNGWILRMQCVPGAGPALAKALAAHPDTRWVQLLSGDTEVLCHLRGAAEQRDALLSRLPRSGRIVAVTAHSLLHVFVKGQEGLKFLEVLPPERVAALRHPAASAALALDSRGVARSELDDALFAALALDGRASHAELAATLGWSESTIRRRLDQLLDAGHLYLDLELDLNKLGFRACAWLWLSVRPSELAEAGKAFGDFAPVAYACATSGPSNLAVCAVCRDDDELYHFLTSRAGSLPGVDRVETSPVIRTVKQSSPNVSVHAELSRH